MSEEVKNAEEKERELAGAEMKYARLSQLLKRSGLRLFEYSLREDELSLYNEDLVTPEKRQHYLASLKDDPRIKPEDRWRVDEFFRGDFRGPLELNVRENDREIRKVVSGSLLADEKRGALLIGYIQDVTELKERETLLELQARTDSLTKLYNHSAGRELVNQYLNAKDPFASCGIMVLDIDYFKTVNDTYGHLFGDVVLCELAKLLNGMFDREDILIRCGGDEFVVFLKNIGHSALVKKAMQFIEAARRLTFEKSEYSMTCSVGVCFLPENVTGYTYDQLFANADWALYRAKENGRNQYAFCDSLQRFRTKEKEKTASPAIDPCYLRKDIAATVFEIFEKMTSFDAAMELALRVIGVRLHLDRITVLQTNVSERNTRRQFQWRSEGTPEAMSAGSTFTREDFLTLFQSYDEYGTAVLQHDDLSAYSPGGAELLVQGGAKSVVYAAMYSEGRYTGAIAYVACRSQRRFTKENRREMGELTKIITAYLTRDITVNRLKPGGFAAPEFDSLTGLLAFSRFKEDVEQKIRSGYASSCVMVYSDFENFKYFNRKYGYSNGDELLKDYSGYIISHFLVDRDALFCRVVSDQFLMFFPSEDREQLTEKVRQLNDEFVELQKYRFPNVLLRVRSGIYFIEPDCVSAAAAIDAANFARKQVRSDAQNTFCLYDRELRRQQEMRLELLNGMPKALENMEFKLYLQPKISVKDGSVAGAEALARWKREDGTILPPDQFIPLFEEKGKIVEMDFYMFERTVQFLAECAEEGLRPLPISVNASVYMARNETHADHYAEILNQYGVYPGLLDIELTETATVSRFENVRRLFTRLQEKGLKTSLDDFGAGYSVLNTVVDIPIDTVKIDWLFINRCCRSRKGIFFLKQTVQLIRGLGYRVVCEGVETERQAEIMKEIDCDLAQGYYYAKPLPAEEFKRLYMK